MGGIAADCREKRAAAVESPAWSASTSITTRPRPWTRACWRRCCPCCARASATPRACTGSASRRARRWTRRGRRWPASIGANPSEIVFTSSGTEADNMARARGGRDAREPRGASVVYSAIEHHAVMNTAKSLAEEGVAGDDRARRRRTASWTSPTWRPRSTTRTALVAVMLANNETGVIQPLTDVVTPRARARGPRPLRRRAGGGQDPDRRARPGRGPARAVRPQDLRPEGRGRRSTSSAGRGCARWVRGGSQERNRRAGTENVAGIVGMGRAAALAREELAAEAARVGALRDRLEAAAPRHSRRPPQRRTAPACPTRRNVSFEGIEAESLLMALDLAGVAVSTGAACAAGAVEPSHVLRGMGLPLERVQGSVRFSLGRGTTRTSTSIARRNWRRRGGDASAVWHAASC